MNADKRRFAASALICILEADLAKDAVRTQADAGLSEPSGWRAWGGARNSYELLVKYFQLSGAPIEPMQPQHIENINRKVRKDRKVEAYFNNTLMRR